MQSFLSLETDLWDLLGGGGGGGLRGPLAQGGLQHLGLGFEEGRMLERSVWYRVERLLNDQDGSASLGHAELDLNSDPTAWH